MIETKVIVIGGGHAGAEAAAASARLGVPTVLITQKKKPLAKCHATRLLGV